MTNIPAVIDKLWDERECPVFDGILYRNGSITNEHNEQVDYFQPLESDDYTFLIELNAYEIKQENIKITCGGSAAWGNDGFIAMMELNTGKLIWLYYSTLWNPFRGIEHVNNNIICTSTGGYKAEFPIKKTNVVMKISSPYSPQH